MSDGPLVKYLRTTDHDLDIIKRAIVDRWPIGQERKKEIVEELMGYVRGDNGSLAVKASRILGKMVADDQSHEISILGILQRDQQESTFNQFDIESSVLSSRASLRTGEVHELLESEELPQVDQEDF